MQRVTSLIEKQNMRYVSNSRMVSSLFLGIIMLAYVAIAWQAIRAPLFVLDDMAELSYVRACPSMFELWQHDCFMFFRPVKNLLFLGFDALLPYGGVVACRLVAMAIGLVSAMVVYAMFRRLLRHESASVMATACWLLAPTMVTCTAWLSSVNIQLMTACVALSLLLFWQARERTGLPAAFRLAGAGLAALLAMLCYEGAVCLPALLVLHDYFLYPERLRTRRTWQVVAVAMAALLLYLLLRLLRGAVTQQIGNPNFGEFADWQVAVAAPVFFWQHLAIWAWPFGRQAISGGYFPGQVSWFVLGCAWLGVAVLVAGCVWWRRRFAFAALGLAWFLVAFLPMSNILAFRNGPYGDYYLALASMGLALALGWGVGALADRGWQVRWALLVMVLVGGWRLATISESVAWSQAWNAPAKLFERTLQTFPHAFTALNESARFCFQAGNYAECLNLTSQAQKLAPHDRTPHVLRAMLAERRGQVDLAWKEVNQFMQAGGTNESWGWYFQGYLLDEHASDTNGAVQCYRNAIAHRSGWSPDVLDAMCSLAYFAVQRGDLADAIRLWEQVVQIDPARWQIQQNLTRAYRMQ